MKTSRPNPRRQRGLTLVELGVAIAMSSVLIAAAAPDMRRFVDARRLDAASARLSTDLQFVRVEAIARNQPVRISAYDGVEAGCYVIHTGASADCRCQADGRASCSGGAEAIKSLALPAAERIALSANVGSMLFDPALGTVTPTGTWRVTAADGRAIHHVVNLIGRVRTCSPNAAVTGQRAC